MTTTETMSVIVPKGGSHDNAKALVEVDAHLKRVIGNVRFAKDANGKPQQNRDGSWTIYTHGEEELRGRVQAFLRREYNFVCVLDP